MSAATAGTIPTSQETAKRSATHFDPNPARAGWFTKIVLTILCVLWLIPLVGTLITSLRTSDQATNSGWWSIFFHWDRLSGLTLKNYSGVLDGSSAAQVSMGHDFVNSIAISLPATFIPILVAAFAAYAFTFMEFKGREVLFLLIVSMLVVPNYVAFVPILNFYQSVGIQGFPAIWLAHVGFGMSLAVYILRGYMVTLPKTVIESAKIDGASHFQTFYKLVLPMSVPALASFAIFQFLWTWNDLMVALVFAGSDQEPLTVGLTHFQNRYGLGWELVTAGSMLTMIVPVIVFLALQRYFVRGLTAGAVKG